jgi:hypothetical protein
MTERNFHQVRREIRLMQQIRYEGAVKIQGTFEDAGAIYIVQEVCAKVGSKGGLGTMGMGRAQEVWVRVANPEARAVRKGSRSVPVCAHLGQRADAAGMGSAESGPPPDLAPLPALLSRCPKRGIFSRS